MSANRAVTMPERTQMRALRADGFSLRRIARLVGRSGNCVRQHVGDIAVTREPRARPGSILRLRRLDALFAACNRSLGRG